MSRLSENGSFSLNMRPLEVYSGRTIHDLAEGDKARHDLDHDGGKRARMALEKARGEE